MRANTEFKSDEKPHWRLDKKEVSDKTKSGVEIALIRLSGQVDCPAEVIRRTSR